MPMALITVHDNSVGISLAPRFEPYRTAAGLEENSAAIGKRSFVDLKQGLQ